MLPHQDRGVGLKCGAGAGSHTTQDGAGWDRNKTLMGRDSGAVMHAGQVALAMVVLGLAVVLQCLQARCIHSSYDFSPEVSFQLLSLRAVRRP